MKFLVLKYLVAIQRRLWLIGLLVVFAVVTSYGVTKYTVSPEYRATTKLLVNVKPTENADAFLSDVMAYPKLMKTYSEILKSYTVTSDVVNRLNLKMTPEQLAAAITVVSINESQIVGIQVVDTNDQRAAMLADEVAYSFISKIEHIMQADNIFVLDKAQGRPVSKLKPNLKMNLLMAVVLSLAAGIGGVGLREYFDTRLKAREEIKMALGLVTIGEIGVFGRVKRRSSRKGKRTLQDALLGWNGGDGRQPEAFLQGLGLEDSLLRADVSKQSRQILENYQALYRNLLPLSILREIKTLVLTSTMRQEGKTTVCTHFAVLLAQSGQRVLLIDGDVEHPTLHHMLQVPHSVGLGDCLSGRVSVRESIQRTRISNLDLLPCGNMTQSSVKALGGEEFASLLQGVRAQYDLVLIDTSAMGQSYVPQVVAPLADGVLFLVGSGMVKRDQAKLALDALYTAKANVLGAVLNNYEGRVEDTQFFLERVQGTIPLNK